MKKLITLVLCVGASYSINAQKIKLIKDINTRLGSYRMESSQPQVMGVMKDGTILFRADDGMFGYELWRTDGTDANTYMVKDIFTGGNDGLYTNTSIFVNGLLYFIGRDRTNGAEPWISDGTAEGTFMLRDIDTSIYSSSGCKEYSDMIYYKNRVYFSAHDGGTGVQLWSTDGTKQGTTVVNVASPKTYHSYYGYAQNFRIMNGLLFFAAWDAHGYELWTSDGTQQGTKIVADLFPGPSDGYANTGGINNNYSYTAAVAYKNKLYFQGRADSTTGFELYSTDGNTISQVKEIHTRQNYSSHPYQFKIANGILFFVASDFDHGTELWRTDGTTSGTQMVKDIAPSYRSSIYSPVPGRGRSVLNMLTVLNNKLIFVANDDVHGFELWESDGTEAGTKLIKDINPGIGNGFEPTLSEISFGTGYLRVENTHNGICYFAGNDGVNGRELWQTDGTAAGTFMVENVGIHPTPAASSKLDYIYVDKDNVWLNMSDGNTHNELFLYKVQPQGVNDAVQNDFIKLYPNPAHNFFTVELDGNSFLNGLLQVFDLTGKEVYNQSIARGEQQLSVGLGDVPAGVYLIKVTLDRRVTTKSITIK